MESESLIFFEYVYAKKVSDKYGIIPPKLADTFKSVFIEWATHQNYTMLMLQLWSNKIM